MRSESRLPGAVRVAPLRCAVGVATVAGFALLASGSIRAGATVLSLAGLVGYFANMQSAYRANPERFREKVNPIVFYAAVGAAGGLLVATVTALVAR